jgi:ribosomal protein S6--L-glutamate ligase
MRIAILSRGPQLYSTQSLIRAAGKRGHKVEVIDVLRCRFSLRPGKLNIFHEEALLRNVNGVIARIGSSVTQQGVIALRQFEQMKIPTTTRADALLLTRDKFTCLQKAEAAGLDYPRTVFSVGLQEIGPVLKELGIPLVVKLLQGTHGMGVMLLESKGNAQATLETLLRLRERFLLQEYIKDASGTDVRAIVIGGEVVAAMKRRALPGDFRANLHRGGTGIRIKLTSAEEEMALKATATLGLDIAGVDMLPSGRGPLLLEVNASPGLEGIESVTKVDVAGKMVEWLEKKL